jgi:putative nucleotidyltransferase with HDIG domain
MSEKNIDTKLKKLHELPTLPAILSQCNTLLKNPNVSPADLAKVIKSDQSITSKVLKLVNSAFYGLNGNVSTISQAIVILGFNTLRSIILSVSVFELLPKNETFGEFRISRLWEHSIGCAVIAKLLAQRLGVKDPEEAFTAGLLHDIGKVVIAKLLREEFITILETTHSEKILFLEAEQSIVGTTHAQLGERIAKYWKLPPPLIDAIALHHHNLHTSNYIKLVSIVHLADIITRGLQIRSGGDKAIPEISTTAWDTLTLNIDLMERWLGDLDEEFDRASAFFSFLSD